MSDEHSNAIEQGKYSPSLEVAFLLARVFGLRVDEVFHYGPKWPLDHPGSNHGEGRASIRARSRSGNVEICDR